MIQNTTNRKIPGGGSFVALFRHNGSTHKTVGHGLLRIVGCGARQAADQKGHFRR